MSCRIGIYVNVSFRENFGVIDSIYNDVDVFVGVSPGIPCQCLCKIWYELSILVSVGIGYYIDVSVLALWSQKDRFYSFLQFFSI